MASRYDSMATQYNASPQLWVHGEDVTYAENGVSGTTVKAIVFRRPLAPVSEARGQRVEYGIEAFVSSAEVENPVVGTSTLSVLVKRDDATPDVRKVRGRVQVGGGWHLTL